MGISFFLLIFIFFCSLIPYLEPATMHPVIFAAGALALAGFVVLSLLNRKKDKSAHDHELPGPKLVPFIGRIHDLPVEKMWNKFAEWGREYGPIYRTEMLGAKFIIVSDESVAEDLLVRRAKTNSDRPTMRSLYDSKSSEGSMSYLPLMGRNQYWARQRQWGHSQLTEAANSRYYGIIDHEVRRWMYRLLTEPHDAYDSLEDMASKVMTTLTWDTPDISEYNTKSAWGLLTQMSPAGPITNLITPLWTHIPEAINPWKIAERKRRDEQFGFWLHQYQQTREKTAIGEQRPCWARGYVETVKNSKLSGDKEAAFCIGMLCLVGVFTVAGPLNFYLLAMAQHPEWQKKVQDEIDRVCGGRYPTFDDFPNLPVLRACIKETMRWKPNVPTGVAHEAEQDDFYRGWFIPKGARILPLDIAFLRNEKKYPDAYNFRPERWLEAGWPTYQEPLTQYPTIKGMTSFGWGRRQCLGMALTQDETILALGALAASFTIKYKIDPKTGLEQKIDAEKTNDLLIIKPDYYELDFEPRSEEKRKQVIALWEESQARDDKERADFLAEARAQKA